MELLSILPTPAGLAVFMRHKEKTGVIFVDPSIGFSIPHLSKHPRPLTHDAMLSMMDAFGIRLKRAGITEANENIYSAHIVMEMENEISELKITELDVRPSDAIILCTRTGIPLQMSEKIWSGMHDVSRDYNALNTDRKNNNMIDFKV